METVASEPTLILNPYFITLTDASPYSFPIGLAISWLSQLSANHHHLDLTIFQL